VSSDIGGIYTLVVPGLVVQSACFAGRLKVPFGGVGPTYFRDSGLTSRWACSGCDIVSEGGFNIFQNIWLTSGSLTFVSFCPFFLHLS
jgi:hypothetical protein